jgi:hypothetical protein
MSLAKFDDECPGCRPAILDVKTGKVLPDEDPLMQKMLGIWQKTTLGEREAYHRVMCLNSRNRTDLFIVNGIIDRLQAENGD